jgi:hypothetical protein
LKENLERQQIYAQHAFSINATVAAPAQNFDLQKSSFSQ